MTTTTMTVASTLRRIKRLKGNMDTLSARCASAVSYPSESKPAFLFTESRRELDATRTELVKLRAAVARANAVTMVEWEGAPISVAEAIGLLQEIKAEIAWLRGLTIREGVIKTTQEDYDEASFRSRRLVVETTYVADLKEVERAQQVENLADKFERLNALVEAANHSTRIAPPQ